MRRAALPMPRRDSNCPPYPFSVPPEQLLSALLILALYGIRSERQLMEQLNYNLLYRWFVGLSPDDPVWDPTTFTKNRERLQAGEVFEKFMTRLLNHPR